MPNALLYGVPYETFWRLNPKRLEPFGIKREKELKEQATSMDHLAWSIGSYVTEAIGVFFAKGNNPYPSHPHSDDETTSTAPKGEVMTDGARFAAFAAEHNRQIRQRKK